MDDKAAVAVALSKRDVKYPNKYQYDRVILVMTGVQNRQIIAEGMKEFLYRAQSHRPGIPHGWDTRVSWFQTRGNIMDKDVSHELWYKNLQPTMPLPWATGQSLAAAVAKAGSDATVDMFQLAPCADTDVWDFINGVPNIRNYHLFFGYNSRQGDPKGLSHAAEQRLAKRQSDFHATLQQKLQAKHQYGRLIFTQNEPTFKNARAGSQNLDWCRRYFPEQDVNMSLYDRFWTKLIRAGNNYVSDSVKLRIPQDDEIFLRQVVEARQQDNALRRQIYAMLTQAGQSQQFVSADKRSWARMVKILIPEFEGAPKPTLELGDANHITAIFNYLDQEAGYVSGAGQLQYAVCDQSNTNNPSQPPDVRAGSSWTGHGFILTGCDIDRVRDDIARMFH
ncbi:uncharacterized protein PgNI_09263 [Pyricularia grisea]|uniref:Uncharacterized protein n=1 Tax=Pyricularia grisea TaxID=148305 RepID=A0A6P8ASE0_PYRGI|nr:uncharacterized protein PgNI_09263 [Pyricularia grisea]TLD05012.1 hypothetical protein PgNI_09263 [Pyricularia grisea]